MDPTPDKDPSHEKPPSRGTADESSVERKFWGMEDEEEPSAGPAGPADQADPVEDDLAGVEDADDPESGAFETESADQDEAFEEEREDHDPLDDDLDDDLDGPLEDSGEVPATEDEPVPASPDPAPRQPSLKLSRRDAVWIGALGLFLLVGLIYAIGIFKSNIKTVGDPDQTEFPVKGDKVVIRDITTFWRKPDREGGERVKIDAHLIPCAVIRLKSGSGSGRLRFFFENEEGEVIGDPVFLEIADGKFADSGSTEATINATDGFEHEGEYNAYVTERINFWYVSVFEGPPADAAGGDFKKITRVLISPKRR